MALWSKFKALFHRKPRRTSQLLLNHSATDVAAKIEARSMALYALHKEHSWQHLREIILLAMNNQVLKAAMVPPGPESGYVIANIKGRIESLDDVIKFVDHAFETLSALDRASEPQGPDKVTGSRNITQMRRKPSGSAGLAI